MLGKFGFLVLIAWAIVSVVESSNVKVVRQLNPDTNSPPFADSFSNRQCSSSSCPRRSTCAAGGGCCMCQCLYDFPNVFVNRTSTRCMSYEETNRVSSANCQYSFRTPNEPLEVIALTEEATGKIRFRNDSARVDCTENGLSVDKWQFLDFDGRWQDGEGNVFTVEFRTVGGRDGNKKDLTFLNWNARLNSKYAGLLIKLSLMCGSRNVGCILAKINGTQTYDISPTTTSAPTSTSQQPSTDTPSTPVPEETTTTSPTSEPESTEVLTSGYTSVSTPGTDQGTTPGLTAGPTTRPTPMHILGTTPGESSVRPNVPGSYSSTGNAPTRPADKQQATHSAQNASPTPIRPILGVTGGLISLICLICLIAALYRRRKKSLSERPAKDPEADSETKLEDYQDAVYAELPDNTETAGEFDNPVYSDPTEEQFIRRSKQDPLPALPVDESTYQSLDQNTRTVTGTSVSSSLEDAYLNPEREEPDTIDYDNPPVSSQVPIKHDSSDYDNPLVGSSPPTNTPRLEKLNNESSEYDNPPVQGNNTCPPTNTSSDYDNPPVQDTPQGVAAESVPESTEDTTEPEYFVLEPEDSSL